MSSNTGENDSFKLNVRNSLVNISDEAEQMNKIIAYVIRVTALSTGKREADLQPDDTFDSLGVNEKTAIEIRDFIANELSLFLSRGMFKEGQTIRSISEYVRQALKP